MSLELSGDTQKTIEEMYTAGVHVGYSRSRRHPSVTPHVYAVKNRVDIINLNHTHQQIADAKVFLSSLKNSGKKILFVGTKPEIKRIIEDISSRLDMPFVSKRWVGGTMTNFKEIRGRVDMLEDLEERKAAGTLIYRTKKELLMLERKTEKLSLNFAGLKDLTALPGALFVIDPLKETNAVQEARLKNIPIIAIGNTDCDMSIVDYPIVANDASQASVSYIVNALIEVIKS